MTRVAEVFQCLTAENGPNLGSVMANSVENYSIFRQFSDFVLPISEHERIYSYSSGPLQTAPAHVQGIEAECLMVDADKVEQFVQLVTQYQQRVFLFIYSLVPNRVDAEEILQETNLILWRRFDEFRPGSDFRAWAFQIAFHKVQQWRDQQRRDRLCFGDDFVSQVASTAISSDDDINARNRALASCLKKLSAKDRDLIERRYRPQATTQSVAEEVNRSVAAVYKAVARIRHKLHECILRTLATEQTR
jgi:RNA polymerase sigma-70 factor (ECF subfamily)